MSDKCSKCRHDEHVGLCGWRKTKTIRDDVSLGSVPATGTTRTMLVDSCSCLHGIEVGQWVTFSVDGREVRAKVTEVRDDGYTVQQFPDSLSWLSYDGLEATESDVPTPSVQRTAEDGER